MRSVLGPLATEKFLKQDPAGKPVCLCCDGSGVEEREPPPKYNSGLATAAGDPISYELTALGFAKASFIITQTTPLSNSISKFPKPLTWSPLKEPFA